MAAFEIIALDTATPQLRAPGAADTYLAPRAISLTPAGLTGAAATSSLSIAQTWNTTGTPTAIDLNVTDTASNAASLLINLRVGGVSQLNLSKAGRLRANDYAAVGDGDMLFYRSNLASLRIGTTVTTVAQSLGIGLGSNSASSPILRLEADAANILAQRNGVNAQAFRVYNSFTDASNLERGYARFVSNRFEIGTEALGTGAYRPLVLDAVEKVGGFDTRVEMAFSPNATYNRSLVVSNDGGAPIVFRVSNSKGTAGTGIFGIMTGSATYAGDVVLGFGGGGVAGNGPAGGFARSDTGVVRVVNATTTDGGSLEFTEQTAPAAPTADRVRIYAEDNGGGKTRLMARFATGAAVQIAIEP